MEKKTFTKMSVDDGIKPINGVSLKKTKVYETKEVSNCKQKKTFTKRSVNDGIKELSMLEI